MVPVQETQETQVQALDREDPLEDEMAPTPVFLPGKFHGQKSLVATVHGVAKSQTRLSTDTVFLILRVTLPQ